MSWPTNTAAPTRCRAEILRSFTSTPSASSAVRTRSVGGTPAAVPNASRTDTPAVRPSARPAKALDGNEASIATVPRVARGTSHVASFRTGRTSSGPATTRTATTQARRNSGNPQREKTWTSSGTNRRRRDDRGRSRVLRRRAARSRDRELRPSDVERGRPPTIASARTIAPTRAARQTAGAHPRTVTSACPTSSSSADADSAMTAPRPTRNAPRARSTASIVRRFLRPGSDDVRSVRLHEPAADPGCSLRLVPGVTTAVSRSRARRLGVQIRAASCL